MSVRVATSVSAFSVLCSPGGSIFTLSWILALLRSCVGRFRNEEGGGGQGLTSGPLGRWRVCRRLFPLPSPSL